MFFDKPRMNHLKKPKRFLDLSSSLKLSGIDVTAHIDLTDTEKKKLMTAYPYKNKKLAKKEATSSASKGSNCNDFLSRSYYNRFSLLIKDLNQDILKGNNN